MTPLELLEYAKAFGVPGGIAMAMLYLWTTRRQEPPPRSRLEEDIAAIGAEIRAMKEDIKEGLGDRHAISERVTHIEAVMETRKK